MSTKSSRNLVARITAAQRACDQAKAPAPWQQYKAFTDGYFACLANLGRTS